MGEIKAGGSCFRYPPM